MGTTNPPSGFTWSRFGNNGIALEWKITDNNYDDGVYVNYQIWSYKQPDAKNPKGTYSIYRQYQHFIGDPKTPKFVTYVPLNEFYPNTKICFNGIYMRIKAKKTDAEWSRSVDTDIHAWPPSKPTLSVSVSDTYNNQATFTWAKNDNDTSFNWVTDYERQTMLVKDCNTNDGSKLSWSGATIYTGGDTEQVITETMPFEDYHSYTRWYRVRCRGPRGDSPWAYAHHVYSAPSYAENVTAEVQNSSAERGYTRVNIKWTANPSPAHPIDKTTIEYLATKPTSIISTETDSKGNEYRHITLTPPSLSGGTTVTTVKDTTGQVITISNLTALDNCIVVRVNTHHDKNVGTGETKYVTGSFANLKAPTITSVGTLDPITKRISISATNNSEVDNTHLAIFYKSSLSDEDICVGIIPDGESTVTVTLPDSCTEGAYTLAAVARLGDYSPVTPEEERYTNYILSNDIMSSSTVWLAGDVPQPPSDIILSSPKNNTIRVTWKWTWSEATGAELSWADHEDAWESTSAPSTYTVNNTSASAWNISDLAVGKWYIRIRLFKESGDTKIYGSYSDLESITISSAPAIPALTLSDSVIPETGEVSCYWVYVTGDGTEQQQAEICEATVNNDGTYTYGDVIAKTNSAQSLTILAEEQGWKSGETHYLAVRVMSASGEISEGWSVPVSLAIADKAKVSIYSTSLVDFEEIIEDGSEIFTSTYKALTSMPLSVTIAADDDPSEPIDGVVTIIIERADGYHIDHPDESDFDGFEGETIAIISQNGSGSITFEKNDLMGSLNDGATYNLIATVTDTYGQTASSNPLKFTVRWDHQAVIPEADVELDYENIYAFITPIVPSGYELTQDTEVVSDKTYYIRTGSGTEDDPYVYTEVIDPSGNPRELEYYQDYDSSEDKCDIYRLCSDKPVLLLEDAEFGTKYADPYPTLKQFGGYRVVYKTSNGDYITGDSHLAWTDYDGSVDLFATIIDFGGDRVVLPYNLSINNSWSKDFTETKYLGGSVQGDWNDAVSRTGSVKTTTVVIEDPDTIKAMRRLAEYAGICHARTPDGSNFTANVTVTEDREEKWVSQIAKFSLSYTRVDPEDTDGIQYSSIVSDNE